MVFLSFGWADYAYYPEFRVYGIRQGESTPPAQRRRCSVLESNRLIDDERVQLFAVQIWLLVRKQWRHEIICTRFDATYKSIRPTCEHNKQSRAVMWKDSNASAFQDHAPSTEGAKSLIEILHY